MSCTVHCVTLGNLRNFHLRGVGTLKRECRFPLTTCCLSPHSHHICLSSLSHGHALLYTTAIMVRLALIFAVVITEYVYGRPPLPPLPTKDNCYLVTPEVQIFRVEGEAVILSFSLFERELKVRNLAPPTARYLITKDNGTEHVAYEGDGRVQQRNKQLWFLPAQASDSGDYICTYRNGTHCVTGSITLYVYKSTSLDMEKLSYNIPLVVGETLNFKCPSLDNFNKTDRLIEWHKESSSTDSIAPFGQDSGKLMIPAVRRSHAGVYICQLTVLINHQEYKVSRILWLHVQGTDPAITTTVPDLSMTSDPELDNSSSDSTAHTPIIPPPVIVLPLNGTIFESPHGSGLDLFCKVLTECKMADSTVVMWLVNGQSVESSYLNGWALQGGRRVSKVSGGCQIELRLVVVEMTEENVKTELKCITQNQGGRQEVVAQFQLEDSKFTWLVVAAVAISCFLTVVSIFLYILFKPKRKKKMDYILARQNSTF
ncbi:interleukin-1 receptor type 2 isoform X2 [Lates calcarifer]|uniref:Interleukin-1 receptor type 2 isoform X2 n=1 Tax=Lates calcarifer TaxID=8187 RepID=A0AAJ7VG03_LATCA|nr:interleukin-1 receptor type 2 isoform X2 [Lates calcarifer]